ncbi:hypothetical protein [Aestuariibaculum suncheonense]|uniref:Uncharacterized protein n=1 Tax=Aestuariibaculum suncheonense TaxID=1028745 RepID=A0A8J6QFF7_9FLAO|nr:hypothetical protein [Aestuariibaculum suncheonense]MBD0835227.1 hypothetical protein [Aestuariibaculum suncheonense]
MNLRKLFGLQSKDKKPYEHADVLHLWEDDYLMIELLPKENLEFVKNENKRIDEFGQEHFEVNGFTDITIIREKPFKTFDRQIPTSQVVQIFSETDLHRIEKVVMQGVGLLEGDKAPLGYGSNKFAVIIEDKSGVLENIWITGSTETDQERQNLKQGLQEIGKQFEFIGIDWFKSEYYDLNDEKKIEDYIKNSC